MGRLFKYPLRVRFHECDPQGLVFNANFLAYADIAITELYREALGSWKAVTDEGMDMFVAEATVRFLTPLHFDEEVELVATVTRIGNTATTTVIGVERSDELVAEITIHHVFIDLETRSKAPIPDFVRTGLERYAVG